MCSTACPSYCLTFLIFLLARHTLLERSRVHYCTYASFHGWFPSCRQKQLARLSGGRNPFAKTVKIRRSMYTNFSLLISVRAAMQSAQAVPEALRRSRRNARFSASSTHNTFCVMFSLVLPTRPIARKMYSWRKSLAKICLHSRQVTREICFLLLLKRNTCMCNLLKLHRSYV